MVNANIKIIEQLKLFLNMVTSNSEIRSLFTKSPSDFSRERKLPLSKVVGMLINLPKRSLSIELRSFFESIGEVGSICTKGAFCLQRTKLNPLFFKVWNDLLIECFYDQYRSDIQLWEGFRLLAVDGSNFSVPNSHEALAHFGSADNQHGGVPMARVMQIYDVLNGLTVWGDIFPRAYSENAIITDHINRLPDDSITLFDRGYPSYSLIYLLISEERPKHFLMRCKTTFSKEVKNFVSSNQIDITTTIYPSCEAIDKLRGQGHIVTPKTGIRVRMLKILLNNGETEVLLTNLYDQTRFTQKKLGKLYFMRWKIETAFGRQKNQMQMEISSGHKVICIQQDYLAGLFVSNLQIIIEKQCEEKLKHISENRAYKYKINRNVSWAMLKYRILKIFLQTGNSLEILTEIECLFMNNIEPVRSERHVVRTTVKRKRGKYQTFTNYRRAI